MPFPGMKEKARMRRLGRRTTLAWLLTCLGVLGLPGCVADRNRTGEDASSQSIASEAATREWEQILDSMSVTDTGLLWRIVRPGVGVDSASAGAALRAKIEGRLRNGTRIIDSDEPLGIVLGASSLIPGMTEGLVGMRLREHRQLIVPPELGYGSKGAGDLVKGTDSILFDIEVIELHPSKLEAR